ncbi:MAG: EamA family transporter [Alphaproteobacteria bacterium]|nr:EamA family transporter [Alphaproteobacteria bacterium]
MNGPINVSMTPLEWGMLITLSILWGGSFFFVGVAVAELPPLSIVTLRVGLAAMTLWVVVLAMGFKVPFTGRVWAAFIGMGLLNNLVPFTLIVWGQTHIASGLASILNATTPLFTVVVAHFLTTDERMTPARLGGVLSGLVGVAVLFGPDVLGGIGENALAQVAILGAALSYAFAGIFGRRFRRMGVPPMATATGQVTASAVMLFPVALVVDQPWRLPIPSIETWSALIALAIFSTAVAYILYFRILATAGATNILLVTFLVPVSAILLGVMFLNEILAPTHLAGMALIGLGLAAIDGRLFKSFARSRP